MKLKKKKNRKTSPAFYTLPEAIVPLIMLPAAGVILGPDGKRHPVKAGDCITVKILKGGKFKITAMTVAARRRAP